MDVEVPLFHTYVEGLDRALGGGIPRGSTVLVAGTPGTMKTSLILWMMHENARANGTKALYVSLEQGVESLRAGAALMGMKELHESHVYILDMGQLRRGMERSEATKDWITILLEIIKEAVSSTGYEVLALDSLEALYALTEMKAPRREMFHFLSGLRELGLTTFLIAETPFGSNRLSQWGEDFLADGILNLRQVEVGETEVQLRLRCVKMRWMNVDHNALALNHDGEKFFVTHVISKKK
ncbi:MAG TPA: ATPase domain-containing protein [Thermoplasmata archaeon]|nr:ATPase domain-containing protein [Thermoplasmata archaeon]